MKKDGIMRTDLDNCKALYTYHHYCCPSSAQICPIFQKFILINISTILYPWASNLPPANSPCFSFPSQHNLFTSLTIWNLCFLISHLILNLSQSSFHLHYSPYTDLITSFLLTLTFSFSAFYSHTSLAVLFYFFWLFFFFLICLCPGNSQMHGFYFYY